MALNYNCVAFEVQRRKKSFKFKMVLMNGLGFDLKLL
jgi:hypothetical protein